MRYAMYETLGSTQDPTSTHTPYSHFTIHSTKVMESESDDSTFEVEEMEDEEVED